ncbi:MAG TPA: HD domain-containing phosphohydrolase [Gemmatimonadaceae bacterium]|nr:HD domain-containing phosphohydrolase [Gemmatimonadaceae bacterium]
MDVSRFLTSLAQTLSTMSLYKPGHPARERVVDRSFALMQELVAENPRPEFSFLGDEVVYGKTSIRELRDWDWSKRFAGMGIQRLEFDADVTREDFVEFLDDVYARVANSTEPVDTSEARTTRVRRIRYGAIGIRSETDEGRKVLEREIATATITYHLGEEIDAIKYMHEEVLKNGGLPLLEAEAVVRSLSVAMHGESDMMLPLLMLKEFDQYTTTHCLNVSVLTMALAEHLGLNARDVRTFGVAGLLHDLGKVRIPMEILNKPGKLSDEERSVMQNHTVEGARLIITSDRELDMAAAVAYEHHIMLNGGGYPKRHYQRDVHKASTLVHVCDVYDALRTNRPYRAAWEAEKVLNYIAEKSGSEFEPDIAGKFIEMMRKLEGRVATIEYPDAANANSQELTAKS